MWDRTNQVIRGEYFGIPYRGVVRDSRVRLGGAVCHYVDLFDDIKVRGSVRESIIVEETDDFSVDSEHFAHYM